ncbi:arsenate-mycothiol transferase ArsC [Sphingobacterium hungaricum]|uniref:Protein-tyrosine-phosphatase n=1 Tax=Sphingobacterium hungaricum TaxID=2082723 RepID=A0A928UXY9_9SPHI|nr:protein-tyrosine-phosphatase [Sphingobacterium hungaricum]MBE8715285.1 protein-tyrosine-phosphatase [Sphingobacterium hungaricum]
MNTLLSKTIQEILKNNNPDASRRLRLEPLIDYMQQKMDKQEDIHLNFICTHNSRRSHLAQIWAQTSAKYFKISNVYCYSGGTEATAIYPQVIKTLEKQGFSILPLATAENTIYAIKVDSNAFPIIGFSKRFDDTFNPISDFVAVMTCSQADQECPYIAGADKRFSLPFEDPKSSDNTPQESEVYEQRSLQIANEMFYIFSKLNTNRQKN